MFNSEQNDEECDATDDESSIVAGFINLLPEMINVGKPKRSFLDVY